MIFNFQFALDIFPSLFNAFLVSLGAAAGGYVLAVVLAMAWTLLKRSKIKSLSVIFSFFTEFVRSTPLLVQLYFLYFVGPQFGVKLSPFWTGVIGLGVHYSTYLAEVYRSALNAIPVGQWEAAVALNFPQIVAWRRLIIPQTIPLALPSMANYGISIIKDTPILSAITLIEVLQTAKIIGSETFRYIEPITIVGVIFLIFSLIAGYLSRVLETKVRIHY